MNTDETSLTFLLQLRRRRLTGIFEDIQKWANRPIEFSRDPRGTHLYSIEETKRAYCRRFINLAVAARTLLQDDREIAAGILARAQIETVAMAAFFVDEVSRLIRAGSIEHFNEKVERFIIGSSSGGAAKKSIHVADALRHLQKLDEVYIRHLWSQHPTMERLFSEILASGKKNVEAEDVIATVSVMKNYDLLCDVSHPNALGTFFMFGQPENEDITQGQVRALFINLTEAATWQGHHMLKALNAAVGQSDDYFNTLGLGASLG